MLLDYQAVDLTILSLVSRNIATVHVVSTILAEVPGLDASACERLGLRVVEPSIEQVAEAARPNGRLSFEDRTCLLVCRENAWACVTNDKALRRACDTIGVPVRWGLELMLELVRARHLSVEQADHAAERMHLANPAFLHAAVLGAFREKLAGLRGIEIR